MTEIEELVATNIATMDGYIPERALALAKHFAAQLTPSGLRQLAREVDRLTALSQEEPGRT